MDRICPLSDAVCMGAPVEPLQRLRINVQTPNEVFIRVECMNSWAKRGVQTFEQLGQKGCSNGVETVFKR